MAQPSLGDIYVDAALTDASVAYFQSLSDTRRVATSVFPRIGSQKQSGKYFVYDRAELLRTEATKRAPGTESAVRTYKISSDQYACDVYSIAIDVSEQDRANASPQIDLEEDASRLTVDDITLRMEKDFATAALSTGVWDTESATTAAFSSTGIFPKIATAHAAIASKTGYRPNTLVMDSVGFYSGLMNNPDIIARMSDSDAKLVTPEFVARVFGVEKAYMIDSIETSSPEGSTADTYATVGKNRALLCYTPSSPGPRTPSAGYTFMWDGLLGGGEGFRTKRMEMPWQDAMPRVETDAAYDFKVTGTALGYLWADLT